MENEEILMKRFTEALMNALMEKSVLEYIYYTVSTRLSSIPEYVNANETKMKCISDIEDVVYKHFYGPKLNAKGNINENTKRFREHKLEEFKKDKSYIKRYIFTAANTYCTKKQKKCNPGRLAGIKAREEKHLAKKIGKASRIDFDHEKLSSLILVEEISLAFLSNDAIKKTIMYLEKIHLDDKQIQCFFDRVEGMSFKKMDEVHNESKAQKAEDRQDLYRKRFNQLKKKIIGKEDKIYDLLTRDVQLSLS
jgi:hypothetical protein